MNLERCNAYCQIKKYPYAADTPRRSPFHLPYERGIPHQVTTSFLSIPFISPYPMMTYLANQRAKYLYLIFFYKYLQYRIATNLHDEMPSKLLIFTNLNVERRSFMPVLDQTIVDTIKRNLRSHRRGMTITDLSASIQTEQESGSEVP